MYGDVINWSILHFSCQLDLHVMQNWKHIQMGSLRPKHMPFKIVVLYNSWYLNNKKLVLKNHWRIESKNTPKNISDISYLLEALSLANSMQYTLLFLQEHWNWRKPVLSFFCLKPKAVDKPFDLNCIFCKYSSIFFFFFFFFFFLSFYLLRSSKMDCQVLQSLVMFLTFHHLKSYVLFNTYFVLIKKIMCTPNNLQYLLQCHLSPTWPFKIKSSASGI